MYGGQYLCDNAAPCLALPRCHLHSSVAPRRGVLQKFNSNVYYDCYSNLLFWNIYLSVVLPPYCVSCIAEWTEKREFSLKTFFFLMKFISLELESNPLPSTMYNHNHKICIYNKNITDHCLYKKYTKKMIEILLKAF